ncbi:MAG: hypothetical protein NC548_28885 [Lachnospiraceae bacterium]|nr:hypothetical protein [Lachnospiraceae bacterium]MCM1233732.1 hypothetical protein [Ruminococcus flavefaciens]
MNRETVIKQFYLTIHSKTVEDCYERVTERENCYSHAITDENMAVEDGQVTAICYKGLMWTLDEVGVQKTVRESKHPNGMYSIFNKECVTLKKRDM